MLYIISQAKILLNRSPLIIMNYNAYNEYNAGASYSDFGVSEIFEGDRAVVKNSAGSPAFLPPEAVDPDIRSFDGQLLDIWACGVTLWIFCFGRVPFRGDSILKLHENIREAK